MRVDLAIATAILLLAAVLRFTGLAYGQPLPQYAPEDRVLNTIHENTPIHPDEFLFIQRPLRMLLTGQLNPKFFHNPSFLINTNLAVYWLTGEHTRMTWKGRDEIGARRAAPFRLYINGRVFSALGGMLAVAATYAATRLLTGRFGAASAALVVAASLPMVQHAHYTTTSSLAAGFAMLSVWASFAALKKFRWWLFAGAGLAAGLAAGCRYNAAAVSIVVFVVGLALIYPKRSNLGYIWVILGYMLFPLGFVITTPHVFFDTAFFWSEFQYITNQYIGSDDTLMNVSKWVGLQYELNYLVLFGLGGPASVLALWGTWRGLRELATRVYVMALLAYLIPYGYVVLRTIRPLGADQMLVPIIPPLALLAGIGAGWLAGRFPVRHWAAGAAFFVALIGFPLVASAHVVWQFTQTDTRYHAQAWVHEHLPEGSVFHLYGPYNVPLDNTLYTWTQTYGGQEFPSVEALREQGVQYVIESDAWLWQLGRAGFITQETIADLRQRQSLADQGLPMVYQQNRPLPLGSTHAMHSASYWHQPGITIYCLTDDGCEAARP